MQKTTQNNLNTDSFLGIGQKREYIGKCLPCFIVRGDTYQYSLMKVFEDGLIDAGNFGDLTSLIHDLQSEFVSPSIPDNQMIGIFELGQYEVKDGNWLFDQGNFYKRIVELIIEMNPEMKNLHCNYNRTIHICTGEQVFGSLNDSFNFRIGESELYYSKTLESTFRLFIKESKTDYSLANITILHKNDVLVSGIELIERITMEEFRNRVDSGKIVSEVPVDATIKIYGLGEFTVASCNFSIPVAQKMLEFEDMVATSKGEHSSSSKFIIEYREYIDGANYNIEELRKLYKNVPDHMKRYLGDMDFKDFLIQKVLFDEENHEKWVKQQRDYWNS
jgi:hypothetical protein